MTPLTKWGNKPKRRRSFPDFSRHVKSVFAADGFARRFRKISGKMPEKLPENCRKIAVAFQLPQGPVNFAEIRARRPLERKLYDTMVRDSIRGRSSRLVKGFEVHQWFSEVPVVKRSV
ncbi:MAG TPA: hypothetical protein DEB39_11650 [Planctomycetaceae bacterium]|nr:hypothetical protein [Planctomycetaceae bacterium]